MRLVGIAELPVDLVGNEEEVVLAGDFSEGEHVLLAVQGSGRIARVADEDGLGPRRDELLELGHVRHLETFPDIGMDGLHRDAVHEGECVVVGIERFEDNDLVALVAGNLEREIHAFASGYGDDEFPDINVNADFPVVFFDKPAAEFNQTC